MFILYFIFVISTRESPWLRPRSDAISRRCRFRTGGGLKFVRIRSVESSLERYTGLAKCARRIAALSSASAVGAAAGSPASAFESARKCAFLLASADFARRRGDAFDRTKLSFISFDELRFFFAGFHCLAPRFRRSATSDECFARRCRAFIALSSRRSAADRGPERRRSQ